jgi:dGTPase
MAQQRRTAKRGRAEQQRGESRSAAPRGSSRTARRPPTRRATGRRGKALPPPVRADTKPEPAGRDDRRHLTEDDQRSRFQRDRDRILYTTALRRLGGVTQVASAGEAYVFHNRLTHTLEVAQIARRIAERLNRDQPKVCAAVGGIEPDVVEAAALAHDLGHPPFGHIAEELLNEILVSDDYALAEGFEGNAQSFRIVTKLAVRNEYDGLDLTRATLNAVLKYPVMQPDIGDRLRKWGAYATERDDFEWARRLSSGDHPAPEAEIMDLADDIGYAIHDVEDFFRAGLIPLDRLAQNNAENDEVSWFFETCRTRWARTRPPKYPESGLQSAFRRIIASMPVREPFVPERRQRAKLRQTTATLIRDYVQSVRLSVNRDSDGQCVLVGRDRRMEISMLKELTWTYVIDNPGLATQQHGQRYVVRELFDIFAAAADKDRLSIFPASAREQLEQHRGDRAARLRAVCDLIAGLTEREAIDLFQRLRGVQFGSILDRYR